MTSATKLCALAAAGASFLLPATALANNEPPQNCTATPASAYVGDEITFHAEAPAGTTGTVHWYVDYTDAGAVQDTGLTGPSVDLKHRFSAATGSFGDHISIGYLDGDGSPQSIPLCNPDYSVSERPDLEPTAVLNGPSTIVTGQTATFDASGSSDPEGKPLHFEFDLDGSPGYELDNGANPVARYAFPQAGQRQVSVRVTDPAGHGNAAFRSITITAPAGSPPPPPVAPPVTPPVSAPKVSLKAKKQTVSQVLNSGFETGVVINEAGHLKATFSVVAKGKAYKFASVSEDEFQEGTRNLNREPETPGKASDALRRQLKKRKAVSILVKVTFVDAKHRTATASKTFTLKLK